jgi:hypothetical protein
MYEGYLAEELNKTFCSAECLDKSFYKGLAQTISDTPEDEEDDLVIFWTEWEDEDEDDLDDVSESSSITDVEILKLVSYEDAKNAFLDNQVVYLTVWGGTEKREAEHMDDIVDHENLEGEFKVIDDGRPAVNKYHYEDYEDGTYFEDGE